MYIQKDKSAATLLAINIAVIGYALWAGWSGLTLLYVYLLEILVIGIFCILRMIVSGAFHKSLFSTFGHVLLFSFHFGGHFFLITFLTVSGLTGEAKIKSLMDVTEIITAPFSQKDVLIGVAAFLGTHTFSFFSNFIGKEEYKKTLPLYQHLYPYPRLYAIMLIAIPIIPDIHKHDIWVAVGEHNPSRYLVVVLGALKTIEDYYFHKRYHLKQALK